MASFRDRLVTRLVQLLIQVWGLSIAVLSMSKRLSSLCTHNQVYGHVLPGIFKPLAKFGLCQSRCRGVIWETPPPPNSLIGLVKVCISIVWPVSLNHNFDPKVHGKMGMGQK